MAIRTEGSAGHLQIAEVAGGSGAADEISGRTIAAAAAGRHLAFEVIVRRYDARLRAFTYGLVRDRDAMDDILQEVYLKAYRGLPGFRGDGRLSTWLLRIAYAAAMTYLRRAPHEESVDVETEAADQVPLDELVARIETADQLRSALAALPPELRACILLVHREGFSYQETATILGVTPGTVGWRLSAARKHLLAALKEVTTRG